uniref:NADH-ubiquinone oxidoreductase chain 4L n=2 Tax=Enoplometopus TaxID=288645 RepID=A0A0U1XJM9_9EUCA|nr:NADH dehydrogenase subunit 4L [Enoplometopus occidentalis]YP_009107537.1 NADH dehydrogenase subunit 4L [Enoplometopus debelius]AGA56189.1 NADH dehydrogenase subunit 4L [Enoplometopus occidentalis]AIU44734.1 NADH dehydrogenase subunit 4L [Enoplometopus debelius]
MMILNLFFMSVPFIMVFYGLWSFVLNRKHLLNVLLSLEFVMLGIFWIMVIYLSNVGMEVYFTLFFLTMAACEGALGLSLLISIVRTHGNDCLNSFSTLQC